MSWGNSTYIEIALAQEFSAWPTRSR